MKTVQIQVYIGMNLAADSELDFELVKENSSF